MNDAERIEIERSLRAQIETANRKLEETKESLSSLQIAYEDMRVYRHQGHHDATVLRAQFAEREAVIAEMRDAQTASGNFATGDGVCPFCGEKDFDVVGLSIHLKTGHCEPYNVSPIPSDAPPYSG
jgi:DNA repair exonuclease SbcCD ATPase subunit